MFVGVSKFKAFISKFSVVVVVVVSIIGSEVWLSIIGSEVWYVLVSILVVSGIS